jgi:hypothetical protein
MKTLAAVAAALLLCGCGSGSTASAPPSDTPHPDATQPRPDTTGPGTYVGNNVQGLKVTAEIPTSPTDPRVTKIEQYRKAAGAPPFTYVVVTYDNTSGRKRIEDLGGGYVITLKGQTINLPHVAVDGGVFERYILDHLPKTQNDAAWRYFHTFYDTQFVRPGAKETTILATPKRLASVGSAGITLDDFGDKVALIKRL